MFPGKPDPADAMAGRWSEKVSHVPMLEHQDNCSIQNARHLPDGYKRYLLPVPWVAEHWRE